MNRYSYVCLFCLAVFSPLSPAQEPDASLTPQQRSELAKADKLNDEVVELYSQGEYAAAEKRGEQVLDIRKRILGPDHPDTAQSLNNLAMLYYSQNNYEVAEPLFQQALKTCEKVSGPDHPDTALSLNNLALLYNAQGNYEAAEPLFQRALKIYEKESGPNHPDTGLSLNNLAFLYYSQSNHEAAEPLFQRALKIYEKESGPDHPDTAQILNNLALLYMSQASYEAAELHFERVLKIYEKNPGPDHPDTAMGLNNLAFLYYSQGNYEAAEPLYQRALKICEKSLGPDHSDTARSLNNLALLYYSQGNYEAAEPLFQRSLKIYEEKLGANHPDTALGLNNLAMLYCSQGNYEATEPLFQRALKIYENVHGPDHPDTAMSHNNLALLYISQGNFEAAEPRFQRALSIYEKVRGPDHPDTARCLNNLGYLYSSQNNYEAPEPLYQRALKIYENIHGPDHPYTAMSLNNLALLYMAQGNFEAAEPRFQQALSIYEKVHGPDHPDTALSLNNLASLHYSQNNYEASERLYQRSLKIYENVHGPDHPDIAMSLNNLALLRETNDQPGVGELLDRARRGAFRHVSRVLPALIENEQRLFLKEKFEPEVHMALSWALYHPDDPKVVSTSLAWVANSKGVAQEAAATRNLMLSEALDPKLLAIVRELQTVQKQLAAIAMTLADQSKAEQRLARINELTQKESQLTKQLALATSADGDRKAWIETEPLRRAIPPDSVLVDIARFDQFDFRETSTENKWKPAHYAAWITPTLGEGEPTLIDLGLADEIDALVQSIRVAIQADGSEKGAIEEKGEAEAADQLNASMKKLSEKIWDPIAPCVGDAESILLSPDGGLWLAPWSALPTGENEDLLIKKHSLRLLIRGRDLLAKRDSPVKSAAPVIFADPKFDSSAVEKKTAIKAVLKKLPEKDDGTLRSFSAKGLLPKVRSLPNTAIEASLVGPNLEKIANGKPIAYQERYALESIAKVLKRPKVAVFATHGFFLPSQEVKKDDLMRGIGSNETRSALLDTSGKPIENPLLRCGLLLAGCNARGSAVGDDDGILTGMEITTIDLRGTDMVVLSACETGVGDVKNGEGVAGLRQAFQLAGARTVVSTLWQIPDRDSAIIMNDFFENVAAGQSASEAMRQAQLKRIKSRSSRFGAAHPFFWAAWTVTE